MAGYNPRLENSFDIPGLVKGVDALLLDTMLLRLLHSLSFFGVGAELGCSNYFQDLIKQVPSVFKSGQEPTYPNAISFIPSSCRKYISAN